MIFVLRTMFTIMYVFVPLLVQVNYLRQQTEVPGSFMVIKIVFYYKNIYVKCLGTELPEKPQCTLLHISLHLFIPPSWSWVTTLTAVAICLFHLVIEHLFKSLCCVRLCTVVSMCFPCVRAILFSLYTHILCRLNTPRKLSLSLSCKTQSVLKQLLHCWIKS